MPKWYLFFNISGLSCNMMKTLNLYSYIYHSAKPIPVLSVFHCRLQRFASCVRHKHSAHSIASSFPLFYIHISGASSQTTCRISAFSTTQKSWMNEDVLVFVMLHGRQLWLLLFLLYIMEWVCFVFGRQTENILLWIVERARLLQHYHNHKSVYFTSFLYMCEQVASSTTVFLYSSASIDYLLVVVIWVSVVFFLHFTAMTSNYCFRMMATVFFKQQWTLRGCVFPNRIAHFST